MIRSFIYAISGIAATVKSERNMRIHLAAAVAVAVLGAWLGLDGREWAAIVICCALVMSLECLNTAVEAVVDLASPNIHMDCGVIRVTVTKARRIKIADKYCKYDPHYD